MFEHVRIVFSRYPLALLRKFGLWGYVTLSKQQHPLLMTSYYVFPIWHIGFLAYGSQPLDYFGEAVKQKVLKHFFNK